MYVFQVDGMTCGSCANRVTKVVQAVDESAEVSVDMASKKVRVDSTADLSVLVTALADAGYTATAVA